jgi:hypothetical protein
MRRSRKDLARDDIRDAVAEVRWSRKNRWDATESEERLRALWSRRHAPTPKSEVIAEMRGILLALRDGA